MQRLSTASLQPLRAVLRPPTLKNATAAPSLLFLLFLTLVAVASISTLTKNIDPFIDPMANAENQTVIISETESVRRKVEFRLECGGSQNETQTCPAPAKVQHASDLAQGPTCPDYFRWIHEDLRPWREAGVTRETVEKAKAMSHFRLVIVGGKVYVDKYQKSIQTRDVFTIWGIVQLLRRYPGRVPDLDLMFDCNDRPVVRSRDYREANSTPPPLFRYCGDKGTLDLVFPDWSFWGWAEINIRPWETLLEELKRGNNKTLWIDREPYAHWKGNPHVAETRRDLLRCNVSEVQDWNARLFVQDWILESQQGFNHSNLASQCTHRFKIYIEGYAWSVSEKYILACDSTTLIVKPHYYDFFTRSLEPLRHYWPIREDDKCLSIKFAVHWGNTHQEKAQAIGKAAATFIQEEVKMDYVYDYMFHLLSEYAKLMKFVPKIPEGAVEVCSETMACSALEDGPERKFMMESVVKEPSVRDPCGLPPPHEPKVAEALWRRSAASIRRVERWEKESVLAESPNL